MSRHGYHCWVVCWMTICLLFVTSCSESVDITTTYQSDLCVVFSNAGNQVTLLTDEGEWLNPVTTNDSSYYKEGERLLVTYVRMKSGSSSQGGWPVSVVDVMPVLVLPVKKSIQLTEKSANSLIKLSKEPWFGGGFLNLEFNFKYDNPSIKHSIYLVYDSISQNAFGTTGCLSFWHYPNGDAPKKVASTIVSFTGKTIEEMRLADSLAIHTNEWTKEGKSIMKIYRLKNQF